jgi:hypothetical protein
MCCTSETAQGAQASDSQETQKFEFERCLCCLLGLSYSLGMDPGPYVCSGHGAAPHLAILSLLSHTSARAWPAEFKAPMALGGPYTESFQSFKVLF